MNNPCGPVPLLFITGFLGSGKTTLLNRILDEAAAQGKKIGVIINEWGRVNIDSSLIRAKDIEIEELNDGQVFCSCLSGNFLEALVLSAFSFFLRYFNFFLYFSANAPIIAVYFFKKERCLRNEQGLYPAGLQNPVVCL